MSFELLSDIARGRAVSFWYPDDNRVKVRTVLLPRRFVIDRIQDTEIQPVEPHWIRVQPELRRGRWLLHGYDVDKRPERSFYVESMRSIKPIECRLFRLGFYDPMHEELPPALFGPIWTSSKKDMQRAKTVIKRQYHKMHRDQTMAFAIGLFPVDNSG